MCVQYIRQGIQLRGGLAYQAYLLTEPDRYLVPMISPRTDVSRMLTQRTQGVVIETSSGEWGLEELSWLEIKGRSAGTRLLPPHTRHVVASQSQKRAPAHVRALVSMRHRQRRSTAGVPCFALGVGKRDAPI